MIKLKCLDGSVHIGTHLRFILREAQSVLAKFHLDGGWYQPWYCTSGQVLVGGTSATMVLIVGLLVLVLNLVYTQFST